MQMAYYFATDMKTHKEINGVLNDRAALNEIMKFIRNNNRAYIDCGIIWVDQTAIKNLPNGNISIEYKRGDWAVWCDYDGEPITEENADIDGNWEQAVNMIEQLIIKGK